MKKLMIAAAGAGKTTFLVKESLKIKDKKVLITTFTDENLREIKKKFIELNGYIPKNIYITGWFSFLLQECLKPYQCILHNELYDKKIGFHYVEGGQSALKYINKGRPVYWAEIDYLKHFFDSKLGIYSDKLSKFVVRIHEKNSNLIFERLSRIFDYIFIDEVQDLAGYDLDIIKLLYQAINNVIAVGDPRQTTYSTHHSQKYERYSNGKIREFFIDNLNTICEIDEDSLKHSHRNEEIICKISSELFPEFLASKSCTCCDDSTMEHLGAFFVPESKYLEYLSTFSPIQLRWDSRNKKVDPSYLTMNIGSSKGLTLDRVFLYPTDKMLSWFKDENTVLEQQTKSKFYVGLTRAKFSLGILVPDKDISKIRKIFPIYE